MRSFKRIVLFTIAPFALFGFYEGTVDGAYHVYPGDEIQPVLELAAADPQTKVVKVHAGTYRPMRKAQALIWFNERHDGILLEAVGEVVLTAANPEIIDKSETGYPAVVNHVVYFGDGVSSKTVMRGFKITGANNFVTRSDEGGIIEREFTNPRLQKALFYYADGGGIKVFARAYPTLENLEIFDNYTSPCGGGVSIEHRGFSRDAVTFRNCIFRANRTQNTGSAVDVLPQSAAVLENCLFVGNIANTGPDLVSPKGQEYQKEHGSGALTVFRGSRVKVIRCTFTDNWNGVDDKGRKNVYQDCIFWNNTRTGGISPEARYEMDILDAQGVTGCAVGGGVNDLRGVIDSSKNLLNAPDPKFDENYVPMAPEYKDKGYRPVSK